MLESPLKGLGTEATSGDPLSDHPRLVLHRHKTGVSHIYLLVFIPVQVIFSPKKFWGEFGT